MDDQELRAQALALAVSLCQGRVKTGDDDAYDADVITEQADIFYRFLLPGKDGQ